MGQEIMRDTATKIENETQPLRTSYDSGYEHSWEHWAALRHLVEEAERRTDA